MQCCAYTGKTYYYIAVPSHKEVVEEVAVKEVVVKEVAEQVAATANGGYVHRKPAERKGMAAVKHEVRTCSWQVMRTRGCESNHRQRTCWFKRRRRQVHVW